MYFEDSIIEYIELVRNSVPNSVEVYTSGNCGAFALMLCTTFPGGKIKNLPTGHRIYEYNGNWYDITGKIGDNYDCKYEDAIDIMEYGIVKAISLLKPRYK